MPKLSRDKSKSKQFKSIQPKKKSIKKKTKQKSKKNKQYCSPGLTPRTRQKTCFNRKGLTKIAKAWNKKNPNERIPLSKSKSKSNDKLWEDINSKMRYKCDKEYCWIQEAFQSTQEYDPDLDVFKPLVPEKWFNNKNEWLNTLDIQNIMFQYEDKYPEFRFVGPVPIDFDAKSASGCIVDELCKLKMSKLVRDNIRKLGVIFKH